MFKIYVAWSICADMIIIGGIIYLIFFDGGDMASTGWGRYTDDTWEQFHVKKQQTKIIANDDYYEYALAA